MEPVGVFMRNEPTARQHYASNDEVFLDPDNSFKGVITFLDEDLIRRPLTGARVYLIRYGVLAATTMPVLLLGGEVSADQGAAFESWRKALQIPSVHGLVIGRSLLFPPDDDVASAVDTVLSMVRG